ncbi:MAG TPA: MotA/TolQ/ExbB proton channel family protein [Gammaproteobacteria bacterium]|nr:MotA/TolQ/ExbB proton channel family protein [Gammaproteobacteria bacterium]
MMPNEAPGENLGFFHFVAHTDAVGIGLFVMLLIMSVMSWTIIVGRIRHGVATRRRNRLFLRELAAAETEARARVAETHAPRAPLARIALAGLGPMPAAQIQQSLQHRLDDEVAGLESGQTTLASIASSSPFVGLFGTVWGIYHALIKIAATGQTSLDQVAGPIGEALIMTACGLAVAIPAGLAYNAFQRQIRLQIAQFEKFADECAWRYAPAVSAS